MTPPSPPNKNKLIYSEHFKDSLHAWSAVEQIILSLLFAFH